MPITMQSKLEVVPITPHIGAKVHGLDLKRPLAATDIRHQSGVARPSRPRLSGPGSQTGGSRQADRLFRRDRRIAPAAEIFPGRLFEIFPNIMLISNIRENGEPIGALPDGEMMFHHDMIHAPVPHKERCSMRSKSRAGRQHAVCQRVRGL